LAGRVEGLATAARMVVAARLLARVTGPFSCGCSLPITSKERQPSVPIDGFTPQLSLRRARGRHFGIKSREKQDAVHSSKIIPKTLATHDVSAIIAVMPQGIISFVVEWFSFFEMRGQTANGK
jgi:hypothetical protein